METSVGGGSINLILYLESDLLMQLKIFCIKNKGHYSEVTSWLRWVKSVLELQPLLCYRWSSGVSKFQW